MKLQTSVSVALLKQSTLCFSKSIGEACSISTVNAFAYAFGVLAVGEMIVPFTAWENSLGMMRLQSITHFYLNILFSQLRGCLEKTVNS